MLGGSRDAVATYRAFMNAQAPARWPHADRSSDEWEDDLIYLEHLAAALARREGSTLEKLRDAGRDAATVLLRRQVIHRLDRAGFRRSDIARLFCQTRSAISKALMEDRSEQLCGVS